MKITSDLTNLTTAILILTVQMFIEWTLLCLLLEKQLDKMSQNVTTCQNGTSS
jgi:hypothetical protein